MKIFANALFTAFASLCLLSGCSEDYTEGDNPNNPTEPTRVIIGGYVQKGPFITGADVAVNELDGALNPTGKTFKTQISNDQGNFNVECTTASEYAEFVANGYYFNETTGELSSSTLSLRGLSKIDKAANINALTTLQCNRLKTLIRGGASFEQAAEQSKEEVLELFGLKEYKVANFDDMNIAKSGESNSMLLAISSILQQDRSESEMSELIAMLANDLADDGVVGAEALREKLTQSAQKINPAQIVENLKNRYADLGVKIEVTDFSNLVDFDGDGVVGNDVLVDGEEITLSETLLNVPCGGGDYTITIDSPIKLYLRDITNDGSGELTPDEVYFNDSLYDQRTELSFDATINDSKLEIYIHKMESRGKDSETIYLFDCRGNIVAEVVINQEGDKDAPMPQLGEVGAQVVNGMASTMAKAFQHFNLIEQDYASNKAIYPNNSTVRDCWSGYYTAIRQIHMIKNADSKMLSIYQEVLNVFSAMCYYNMVVAWGDVPYIPNYEWYGGGNYSIARTDASKILAKLKSELTSSIELLDDKKNIYLNDANDFFFVSKDFARILLANIHMYLGEYTEAKELLNNVINNGYYQLDNANYSDEIPTEIIEKSEEVIFALQYSKDGYYSAMTALPIFTYSDVILSYAECLYKTNDTASAKIYSSKVLTAKGLQSKGDTFKDITYMRESLYNLSVGNFAFFKRNGIAEDIYSIQEYQLLLPIPDNEFSGNSQMTQNPGY